MVKKIIVLLILSSLCFPLFANLDMSKAEPYKEGEFPKWSLDIRRSEVIFLGALPFSYIVTSAVVSAAGSNMNFTDMLLISAGAAAAITITDIVLGLFE